MRTLPERNARQRPLMATVGLHGVGVHSQAQHVGEAGADFRFEPLRAQAAVTDAGEAARRTTPRRRHLIIAVMAQRDFFRPMMGQSDVAFGTADHEAAGRTLDVRGKAAPVQQQDHLPALVERGGDGREHGPAQGAAGERAAGPFAAEVDCADRRQRPVQHPAGHFDQGVLARAGPMPALERRRGRTQDQRNPFGLRAGNRHVAGVIAGDALLLERRFVLLVQHDQPKVRRGGEDRAAGADHHRHGPLGDSLPVPVPLGVAEVAVKDRHCTESLAESFDRLRRETDFRHQHDRLPTEMDHLLNGLDVDLGLAAASHAVDEDRLMAARVHGVQHVPQRPLLIGVEDEMFLAHRRRFLGPQRGNPSASRADQPFAPQGGDRA